MIFLHAVQTIADVELLRRIRNECASWMTNTTTPISIDDQVKWWTYLDRSKVACYLASAMCGPFDRGMMAWPVGFVVFATKEDGKLWITYGLTEEKRGQRWGPQLIEATQKMYREETWAEVLDINFASLATLQKCGYTVEGCASNSRRTILKWQPSV